MTDVEFFEAIVADPHDHTLPLIYADWLDERGDPRGEFIRLQTELAALEWNDPRRAEREPRLWELLEQLLPLPQVLVEPTAISADVLERVPETIVRQYMVLPLQVGSDGGRSRITFFTSLPAADTELLDKLRFLLESAVVALPARREDIDRAITHYYGELPGYDGPPFFDESRFGLRNA